MHSCAHTGEYFRQLMKDRIKENYFYSKTYSTQVAIPNAYFP